MIPHLSEEIATNPERIKVETKYGTVTGGRAANGAAVFLEIPFGLPPGRWEDPKPLPDGFQYEEKEYIHESLYAVQPEIDGQSVGQPPRDKLGLGQPTENPLFLNIVIPPSFPSSSTKFPVRVYIHGGFLQFGSPHGLSSQAQFISAEMNEIWVNMGYRLSAFGFLACDEPYISGNFGFKDQWLALEWVKENIASFGGNPDDIRLSGLSAGGHSVHQILHHASRLPEGMRAPFNSAIIQSNSIVNTPKTPTELRAQYHALCAFFSLDPSSPSTLPTLRDPIKTPWQSITQAIDADAFKQYGTFRGTLDNAGWLSSYPDPMTYQRTGQFAQNLKRVGIKSIVVGDMKEEWYLYGIANPIHTYADIRYNLTRYYPDWFIDTWLKHYPKPREGATEEELMKLYGVLLSDAQVHLPVRMLARDLIRSGFPVLRYEIRWTPEQVRVPHGYVTHGSDRSLWNYRLPTFALSNPLSPSLPSFPQTPPELQQSTAFAWVHRIDTEIKRMEAEDKPARDGDGNVDMRKVLTLTEERAIEWRVDGRFEKVMRLVKGLPGEDSK